MVDASGQTIVAKPDRERGSLLWACQGRRLGQLRRRHRADAPAPTPLATSSCSRLPWPVALAADLLNTWQGLAPFWPDEITCMLRIAGGPWRKLMGPVPPVSCKGYYLGDQATLNDLLRPVDQHRPAIDDIYRGRSPSWRLSPDSRMTRWIRCGRPSLTTRAGAAHVRRHRHHRHQTWRTARIPKTFIQFDNYGRRPSIGCRPNRDRFFFSASGRATLFLAPVPVHLE